MRVLTVLLAFSFFVSCGSRGKLSNEQKSELMNSLESAGRAQRTAQAINGPTRAEKDTPDTKMKQSLDAGTCERKQLYPQYDSGSLITGPEVQGFLVQGEKCPIAYRYYTTTTKSEFEKSHAVDLAYSVNQEEYLKLNDVRGLSLSGTVTEAKGKLRGELKGNIASQSLGDIKTEIDVNFSNAQGKATLTFTFPKYTAELSAILMGDKVEYALNGEALTAEQFNATLTKAGPAFSQFTEVSPATSASVDGDQQVSAQPAPAPPQAGSEPVHPVPPPSN